MALFVFGASAVQRSGRKPPSSKSMETPEALVLQHPETLAGKSCRPCQLGKGCGLRTTNT